jgi:hypothetical protein
MATTQKSTPKSNGGSNAVVLKPLNLGKAVGLRARRTPQQVLQSRIQKQEQLAEKAKVRAELLAQRQLRAQQRAEAATQRAKDVQAEADRKAAEAREREANEAAQRAAIQAGEAPRQASTVPVIEKTPQIERMLKDLSKDFAKFYQHCQDTYGIEFEGTDPELVKRGYISIKMRGYLKPQKKPVETTASDTGVAREAVRFMQFYKQVGLTPAWLNREVKIKDDPHTYVLTGLRGKAHSIVLRRKDTNDAFAVSATDFKKMLQT